MELYVGVVSSSLVLYSERWTKWKEANDGEIDVCFPPGNKKVFHGLRAADPGLKHLVEIETE